jgi:23S rRNA (adenine2503-C2)-methyltransferase
MDTASDAPSDPVAPATVDPYDLGREDLERLLVDLGEPAYRGRQVQAWLVRGVDDPHGMTDLPKPLRRVLAERFAPARPVLRRHHTVDDGATHKFLLEFGDGTAIETVLMLYPGRATVCVSTQAGCAMGCPFCATGQAGLERQLSAGEIVRQVVVAEAFLRSEDDRPEGAPDHVTNVVYMGMGEPLNNLAATERSIRWLHDPDGFDLSARAITVSTVGLVPGIRRLTALGLPITLAISLHAPDDGLRDVLVPPNRMHPLAELVGAVREHQAATGRRVSFEYVLIDGVNDGDEQARLLVDVVRTAHPDRGPLAHVNLIPLNPTPGVPQWREPAPARTESFARTLRDHGIPTTVRDTRGRDADAACGQLLANYRLGQGRRLPVAVGAAERVDALREARDT